MCPPFQYLFFQILSTKMIIHKMKQHYTYEIKQHYTKKLTISHSWNLLNDMLYVWNTKCLTRGQFSHHTCITTYHKISITTLPYLLMQLRFCLPNFYKSRYKNFTSTIKNKWLLLKSTNTPIHYLLFIKSHQPKQRSPIYRFSLFR